MINGEEREAWRSHRVEAGDIIELGFATRFCRSYLAVHGGFRINPSFGSTATVMREGIGGHGIVDRDDVNTALPAVQQSPED